MSVIGIVCIVMSCSFAVGMITWMILYSIHLVKVRRRTFKK